MSQTRRNLMWPMVVLALGLVLFLLAVGLLPNNTGDLLGRSWGILFVLIGLNMLLVDRVRFGNWLALLVSGVALGIIVFFAYNTQKNQGRTDYVEAIEPVLLGEHIQKLNIYADMRHTRVQVRPSDKEQREVSARFSGSTQTRVVISLQENTPGIIDLTIQEAARHSIPKLSALGYGKLDILLPYGISIGDFSLSNQRGGATFDFRALDIPRFDLHIKDGDVDLFMPQQGIVLADIGVNGGDLSMFADPAFALRIENAPKDSRINTNDYQFLADGTIESRGGITDFQFNLRFDIVDGLFTLQAKQEG